MSANNLKIKVDHNVPMPVAAPRGNARKYPFDEMKVGDSFYWATGAKPENLRVNLLNAAAHFRKWAQKAHHKHFRIKTATEAKGIRVWRIA